MRVEGLLARFEEPISGFDRHFMVTTPNRTTRFNSSHSDPLPSPKPYTVWGEGSELEPPSPPSPLPQTVFHGVSADDADMGDEVVERSASDAESIGGDEVQGEIVRRFQSSRGITASLERQESSQLN